MSENKQAILKRLEEIFQDTLAEGDYQFSMDSTSSDIEEWDSLSHIRLLTAIEAEFGIQFDISEIELLSSVSVIVDMIHNKTM